MSRRLSQGERIKTVRYAHQSPFPAYHAASGDQTWRMISDFMPIEEFQKTDFCRDGLRSWGLHQIGCVLTSFDQDVKALVLNRAHPSFNERDRGVLNLLNPHLSLSHYNAHAFHRAHQSIHKLQAVVEAAPSGYAYLGETGRIEWATAKAKNLWSRFYAQEAKDESGVPTPVLYWVRECLAQGVAGNPAKTEDFHHRIAGEEKLVTRLLPAALGGWVLAVEAHPVRDRPRFRDLPQLSVRENEVLHWMTEGKRNAEIATILGISSRTVEKHVESILNSLGVENRATAIVSAMGMCAAMNGTPGT